VLRVLVWANSEALRPRAFLVAENLCPRQQLGMLQRRNPQPCLRNAGREFWICASRMSHSLTVGDVSTILRCYGAGG
jgi:hypothetical protein